MRDRLTQLLRTATLALYCIYAMSPIYLSALTDKKELFVACGRPAEKVTVGIVWVKVLFSSLCSGDEETAAAVPRELKANDQERDFILIKKKRAVLRGGLRIKPRLEKLADVPLTHLSPVLSSWADEAPCRVHFRQENIALFSHAGLSPPRFS